MIPMVGGPGARRGRLDPVRAFLLASLAAAGTACSSPPPQPVSLLGYGTSAPSEWEVRAPESSMRLTEFDIGGGAEVIVFYFGAGQGGSAAANIARWESQFTAPDGGPVEAEVSTLDGSTFPTTVAELEGRYARGVGMGRQGEPEDDQALVAAVVETAQGTLFPQLVGPRAAVEEERDAFLDFVRGIAPAPAET